MPIKYRLILWLIVRCIENRDYAWLLAKVVKYVALHIRIDHEDKKWEITSEPMQDQSWQKIDYADIEAIFKAQPSSYHVEETHYPNGKFKSFTVETR